VGFTDEADGSAVGGAPSKAFTPSRGSWASVWLASLTYGWIEGVPVFWLVSIPILLFAAVVCLGEKLYWRLGYCPLPVAATRVYSRVKNSTGVAHSQRGLGDNPSTC